MKLFLIDVVSRKRIKYSDNAHSDSLSELINNYIHLFALGEVPP
ncbi:MAG: hypothetical protein RL092_1076 [Bacteroidota bacterium]|jgi:hypothetical protein